MFGSVSTWYYSTLAGIKQQQPQQQKKWKQPGINNNNNKNVGEIRREDIPVGYHNILLQTPPADILMQSELK